jgi:hypothetical protein
MTVPFALEVTVVPLISEEPERTSLPGPGTLTRSVALPCLRLSVSLPKEKALLGGVGFGGGGGGGGDDEGGVIGWTGGMMGGGVGLTASVAWALLVVCVASPA